MLPDLRFVIGAVVAVSLLGMTAFGLFATVRLTHQAKMGPLETSRNLAFADDSEWNPFYSSQSTRLFEGMTYRPVAAPPAAQPAPQEPASVAQPVAPSPAAEPAATREPAVQEPITKLPAEPETPAAVAPPPVKPMETGALVAAPATGATAAAALAAKFGPAAVAPEPAAAAPAGDQEPLDTGALASIAAGAPAIASDPPAGGMVNAPAALPKPAHAKIEVLVMPSARPAALAQPLPKVTPQARPKVLAPAPKAIRTASAPRPRAHAITQYRQPRPRAGEFGPYFFGTNPWAQ